jgi:hypothetical protein
MMCVGWVWGEEGRFTVCTLTARFTGRLTVPLSVLLIIFLALHLTILLFFLWFGSLVLSLGPDDFTPYCLPVTKIRSRVKETRHNATTEQIQQTQ